MPLMRKEERCDRPGTSTAIALLMVSAWGGMLFVLLRARFSGATVVLAPVGTVAMTLLYTGLFVTAHDAMHGTVAPGRPRVNAAVGWVCTLAFALFDFRTLARAHHDHHHAPASADDPDFHASGSPGFFAWYARFILRYVRVVQIVGLGLVFNVLNRVLGVPQVNLFAFWVAPAALAATQLFYFGTYLPHREPATGYRDECRAESVRLPEILSLLTCFHFGGFHHEHHEHPHVPWWRLPSVDPRHPG